MRQKHVPLILALMSICFVAVSAEPTPSEAVASITAQNDLNTTTSLDATVFDTLTMTPNHVSIDENVTLLFKITNNENRDELVGFIIEHHPPPYLIVDNENMTLK